MNSVVSYKENWIEFEAVWKRVLRITVNKVWQKYSKIKKKRNRYAIQNLPYYLCRLTLIEWVFQKHILKKKLLKKKDSLVPTPFLGISFRNKKHLWYNIKELMSKLCKVQTCEKALNISNNIKWIYSIWWSGVDCAYWLEATKCSPTDNCL